MARIDEVGDGIYRIHTAVAEVPGGFSFNQYLVTDDEPLLFHAGPRALSSEVMTAIERVMPVAKLRWIGISHVEADECGGLNALLAAAPHASPLCGRIAAMVSLQDLADRPPRPLAEGEQLLTGRRRFVWLDAPHLPHGWDCGYLFEQQTQTLLCGDLFTQPGANAPALTTGDILGPSVAFAQALDYWAHAPDTRALLEKLARHGPKRLACMHGSAWEGDGAALLRALGETVEQMRPSAVG